MENGTGFITLALFGFVYFLPWVVASSRHHHNRGAIAVLNLLLGWTILGWIISIVWASTEVHQPAKVAAS